MIDKKSIFVMFVAPLMLLYYEVLFLCINGTKISLKNIALILLYGMCISLVFYLLSKINNKIGFVFIIIVAISLFLIFATESYINKFFYSFMDFGMIFGRVGDVYNNYLSDAVDIIFKYFYIVILNVLPIVLIVVFRKKLVFKNDFFKMVGIFSLLILFLIIGIVCFGDNKNSENENFYVLIYNNGLINGLSKNYLQKKQSNVEFVFEDEIVEETIVEEKNIEDKSFENIEVEENIEYNIMDIDFEKLTTNNKDIENLNKYVKAQVPTKKNKYTGIFKGMNLVLICAESFSKYGVSEKLTPTLYKLIHDGFYFPKSYATSNSASTSEGEFQLLLGMSPINGKVDIRDTIDKNNYFTMASSMKRLGYHTSCYHNGNYYYYNRNITHDNLGYEYYIAEESGLEKMVKDRLDYSLFDATLNDYKDKQPFSVYYMTYDGHLPYKTNSYYYEKYSDVVYSVLGNDISDEYFVYLCKMVGFDKALENYINKLDEEGILDNTVIAFTPDHFPYGLLQHNDGKAFYKLYNEKFDIKDLKKRDSNSFVIWSNRLSKDLKSYCTTINNPVGNVDMLPTLLNLFGIEYDSRLLIGRDVFSDAEPIVFWGDDSFVTNKCYYNAIYGEIKFFDESEYDMTYFRNIKKKVSDKLLFVTNVLKYDYYNYLFKDKKDTKSEKKENKEIVNFGYSGKTYDGLSDLVSNASSINAVDAIYKTGYYNYDILKFGRFEQDGVVMNGLEDLEWIILHQDEENMLLLSKYILDTMPFCVEETVDWEHSILKNYAMNNFYQFAFNELEKEKIIPISSSNINDNLVIDYVNVLNEMEINTFFGNLKMRDKILATKGTQYAINNGLYVKDDEDDWFDGYSNFWIRDKITASGSRGYYSNVEYNGHINKVGYRVNNSTVGFRPAIWIKYK